MDKETKNIISQRIDDLNKENQNLSDQYGKIKTNIEQLVNLNKRTESSIIGNNKAIQELSNLLPKEQVAKTAEVLKDDEKKPSAKKVEKEKTTEETK